MSLVYFALGLCLSANSSPWLLRRALSPAKSPSSMFQLEDSFWRPPINIVDHMPLETWWFLILLPLRRGTLLMPLEKPLSYCSVAAYLATLVAKGQGAWTCLSLCLHALNPLYQSDILLNTRIYHLCFFNQEKSTRLQLHRKWSLLNWRPS